MAKGNNKKNHKTPPSKPKEVEKKEAVSTVSKEKTPLKITETLPKGTVLMKFTEHKYYNDLSTPLFYAGKVYELEGADWIQRWLKRGGEIIEGDVVVAKADKKVEDEVATQEEAEAMIDSEEAVIPDEAVIEEE